MMSKVATDRGFNSGESDSDDESIAIAAAMKVKKKKKSCLLVVRQTQHQSERKRTNKQTNKQASKKLPADRYLLTSIRKYYRLGKTKIKQKATMRYLSVIPLFK